MNNPGDVTEQLSPAQLKNNSEFTADVLKLVGGTTVAQLLVILAAPILTRLYGPEAFGISALFSSVTSIVVVVACLRYELAILLGKRDQEAADMFGVSLISVLLISTITVLIVWFGQQPFIQFLRAPQLARYLWLAPLAILFGGALLALNGWISRKRYFGRLSAAKLITSVAATSIQLVAGLAGYATGGSLIIAGLVGSVLSALMLGGMVWRDNGQILRESISRQGMILGIKRYRKFPLYDTWAALLNAISWQTPILLLSAFFSSTVVGHYSLAMMVLEVPMSLLGSSIAQVFFQRAAMAKFEGNHAFLVEGTFLRLATIGIFPFLMLSLTGKEIFMLIFGASWTEAGVFVQILALWIFFVFIVSPIMPLLPVFEKQRSFLLFNMILFTTRAGALIIGGLLNDILIALALLTFAGVANYAGIGLWLLHKAGVPLHRVLTILKKCLLYCVPYLILASIAKWVLLLAPESILLIVGLSAIPYYAMVIRDDEALQPLIHHIYQNIRNYILSL
jgi:O-antigen/teichoic acid export membrane protein